MRLFCSSGFKDMATYLNEQKKSPLKIKRDFNRLPVILKNL